MSKLQKALSCAFAAKTVFDAWITCRVPHSGLSWQTQSTRSCETLVLSNGKTISIAEARSTSTLDFGSLAIASNTTSPLFISRQKKTLDVSVEGF